MRHVLPLLLVLLITQLTSCKESSAEGIIAITSQDMQLLLNGDSIQLVDVRTPEEFKEGYINGAKHMDYFDSDFESNLKTLDKTKPVIIYCKKGGRSAKSCKKLETLGFTQIYDLKGGISQWKKAGFDVNID